MVMKDMKSLQQEVTEATPPGLSSKSRLLDVLRPGSNLKKRSKSSSIRRFAIGPSSLKQIRLPVLEVDLMHYRQLEQLPPRAVASKTRLGFPRPEGKVLVEVKTVQHSAGKAKPLHSTKGGGS